VSTPAGTRRLPPVVLPVVAAGIATYVLAAVTFAREGHSGATLAGVAGLLVASVVADRYPVPIDGVDSGGVSLAFVFGIAGIVLFGWEVGVLVTALAPTIVQLAEHRPKERIAFNAGVFALSAGAAGLLIRAVTGESAQRVLAQVVLAAIASYVVNIVLVGAVVAESSGSPLTKQLRQSVVATIVPFALMASAALMLVVLWQRTPLLSAALVGPLLAIGLYQRSHYRALRAMRLALTDPLTGLGNHRHFHERLQRELTLAEDTRRPLSLCLLDVDDFKGINDHHGHPVGDRVLEALATRFRQGGESFRLGGDEFAILLPGQDDERAHEVAISVSQRIAAVEIEGVGRVSISVGVASFPGHARERDELVRVADSALYMAKEHGKGQVRVYRAGIVELSGLQSGHRADDAVRFRAAASLAKAVDARDAYTGSHSERVADLAARVAGRLGLSHDEVELTRLAGRLHDLGKLAVPEDILRKAGLLTDEERVIVERHPQIGFRMLESLGVDPVAQWVLHHHERWDGAGYPDGLARADIPLGARILFVADAFDAMTSQRSYRAQLSGEAALAELERCAGSQFDPAVVAALAAELGLVPGASALAS
jgi:diguanylate cyclase (GGDEF)-like protein